MIENKTISKIRYTKNNRIIFIILCSVIYIAICMLILTNIPIRNEELQGKNIMWGVFHFFYKYNIFGECIYARYVESGTDSREYCGIFAGSEPLDSQKIIIIISAILLLILFFILSFRSVCRKCNIELNKDGICGKLKYYFSTKSLDIPIEKIDSIYVRDNIFDKIISGKTIVIKTNSSVIRVSCTANSQEFVDSALTEIKKYKQSVANVNLKQEENHFDIDVNKFQKLKELLEQGLITQEEFEKKRKELLDNI